MENKFECMYCGQNEWVSKKGMRYHQAFCDKNPNKRKPAPKSEAFYKAMKERRGIATNQWTDFDWSSVPFESLGGLKRRELLFKENKYSCSRCGFNETRDCGGVILEVDHIDGDHKNNTRENLRVLCPNCHALTPNFRNWGRSREKTSGRIRKGNKNFPSK